MADSFYFLSSPTFRAFYIVVVPLKKSRGGQFLNPLGSPEEMDLEEVSVGETGFSWNGMGT